MDSFGSGDPEVPDDPTSAFWPCCRPWATDGTLIHPNWDSESEHIELPSSPPYSTNCFESVIYNKVYSISDTSFMHVYMFHLTMHVLALCIIWHLI